MIKYAKVVDDNTKECIIGTGTYIEFYKSMGMTELNVEESYDGRWFLKGKSPKQPEPTLEEQLIKLETEYGMSRVIREGILNNPTIYSEFNVRRAKEIEELAIKIRNLKAGK